MHMVCSSICSMEYPPAVAARLIDLLFHCLTLDAVETTSVFGHSRQRLKHEDWVRHFPSVPIFHPASRVAWKPSSICCPSQKESDWIVHASWHTCDFCPHLRFGFRYCAAFTVVSDFDFNSNTQRYPHRDAGCRQKARTHQEDIDRSSRAATFVDGPDNE